MLGRRRPLACPRCTAVVRRRRQRRRRQRQQQQRQQTRLKTRSGLTAPKAASGRRSGGTAARAAAAAPSCDAGALAQSVCHLAAAAGWAGVAPGGAASPPHHSFTPTCARCRVSRPRALALASVHPFSSIRLYHRYATDLPTSPSLFLPLPLPLCLGAPLPPRACTVNHPAVSRCCRSVAASARPAVGCPGLSCPATDQMHVQASPIGTAMHEHAGP